MDQVAPLPVSAPPRVRDWLAAAADGAVRVLHRGPRALYVDVAGRAVGLLAAGAAQVPNGLRSRVEALPEEPGAACLQAGVLRLAGRSVLVGRTVEVRVPRIASEVPVPVRAHGHPEVDAFVEALVPDDLDAAAVGRLVGRGPGLTPLGDDVVAGWLATARAIDVPTPDLDDAVRAHADRTTLLSATLLDCALHGEALPELGAYLGSLGTSTQHERACALARVGATSGAGLLAGARLALLQLTSRGVLVA